MKYTSDAGKWMADNGYHWGTRKDVPSGHRAKTCSAGARRKKRGKRLRQSLRCTIRAFVERNREHGGHDCLFVPAAQKGVPAQIEHCGKTITAAKYMALLVYGVPPFEGAVVRHKCGNGHLSCVNPNHVVWGTQGDNISDMTKHRHAGDNVQDRIHAID